MTSGVKEYGELGFGVKTNAFGEDPMMGIYLNKIKDDGSFSVNPTLSTGNGLFEFYMLPKTELTFRLTNNAKANADSIRVISKYRKYAKTAMYDFFQNENTTDNGINFISVVSADFTDNYNGTFNMRAKNIYNLDIVIAGSEKSVTVDYHFKLY